MIVLLSGGIAVGKSTVGQLLAAQTGGQLVRVRAALAERAGVDENDRRLLQREGAELDRRTAGRWLLDYLLESRRDSELVVVDAMRTRRQTLPVLEHAADAHLVHLSAHSSTRRHRYQDAARTDRLKANLPYEMAVAHETERSADEIRDLAELVIETDDLTAQQTVDLILAHFQLGRAD